MTFETTIYEREGEHYCRTFTRPAADQMAMSLYRIPTMAEASFVWFHRSAATAETSEEGK